MLKIKKHIDIILLIVLLAVTLIAGYSLPSHRAARGDSFDQTNYKYFLTLQAKTYVPSRSENFILTNISSKDIIDITIEVTTNGETYDKQVSSLKSGESTEITIVFINNPLTYDYTHYSFTARGDISNG